MSPTITRFASLPMGLDRRVVMPSPCAKNGHRGLRFSHVWCRPGKSLRCLSYVQKIQGERYFRAYWQLSEEMIAGASKEDIVEVARILAMQAAHYARKFGELPIPDLAHHLASTADEESVALLRDGTIALVGILGIVRGVGGADIDEPVH